MIGVLAAAVLVGGLAAPAARAGEMGRDARWTFIAMMAGTYTDVRSRLEAVGTGPDVNFVVLHDPFGQNDGVCYSVADDPGPATEYSLPSIFPWIVNQEVEINHPNTIGTFLEWAQTNFPADHYVISFRCRMDFFRFMLDCEDNEESGTYRGLEMAEMAPIFAAFVARNGGQKIDLLNTGFCHSSVIEWQYIAQNYAGVYVGSEHTSNPPVALYWRFYRWLEEAKANSGITAEELAVRIVEIFTSQAYSGFYEDEPATAAAIDLAAVQPFVDAFEAVVGHLHGQLPGYAQRFLLAVDESERFGDNPRHDLDHLLRNIMAAFPEDATLQGLCATARTRLAEMVIAADAWGFRDAEGVMIPILEYSDWNSWKKDRYLESYGPFANDIGWTAFMDALPVQDPPETQLLVTEVNPGYISAAGSDGDRIEIYNRGTAAVDLRGLIIDDGDSERIGAFIDGSDVNQAAAVLQPGQYAVVHLRCAAANPYTAPADSEVQARTYGVEIFSYVCAEGTFLSDYDDQVLLLDGDHVIDAVAWTNLDGEARGLEVITLEAMIAAGAWAGPSNVAMDYFENNWTASPENAYEDLTVDFSLIAGSEAGSLQRVWNGSAFSEGVGGMDSKVDFVVSNDTSLGFPTQVGESFSPRPVPHLLITEIAPNIAVTSEAGDMIEIFNAGTTVVDLYDVILSDLDPGDVEEDVCGDETPLVSEGIGAGRALLQPGRMAVITTVASTVTQPDPVVTSYGFSLLWPAGGQFDVEGDQVVLLNRDGGDLIDCVVYANTDLTAFVTEGAMKDFVWDNDGLTMSAGGFGFVLTGPTAWLGADNQKGKDIPTGFNASVASTVRFSFGQDGGGSIQRILSGNTFSEGNPDGPPQFIVNPVTNFGVLPEAGLGTALAMPAVFFGAGDPCYLRASLTNPDAPMTHVPFAVVLEVLGQYWFYPNWTQAFEVEYRNVGTGSEVIQIIPAFSWPAGAGAFSGVKFYGAMLTQDMTALLGDFGYWEFGFSS